MNEGEYAEQMNIRHDIEVTAEEEYMEQERIKMQMREIKFRGWYDAGEFSGWKYGYLVERYDLDGENLLWYIVNENYKGWEVDPKSVGQYTGLKDKNGKEIYEGDILRVDGFDKLMAVFFKDGYFGWGKEHNGVYNFDPFGSEPVEVIGNIYENPELLKGR